MGKNFKRKGVFIVIIDIQGFFSTKVLKKGGY